MKNIIVILLITLMFSGCDTFKKQEELRVGILSWPGYEPLALADALDYYSGDEIKIIRFPSVIDVLGAMRNGTIDVAALTIDESLVYAQENPDLRAFLVCDISNGGDALIAKKEITDPSQLKGKRIAAEESALSSFILARFLEKSHLQPKDISVVPVTYDTQYKVFSSNEADALITYNPIKDQLISEGANLLFDSKEMPGEIVDVLFAREALLQSKKEAVIHLVEGWYQSLDYMKKHPKDAYKKMAGFQNVPVPLFEHSLTGIKIPSRQEAKEMLSKNSGSLYESSAPLIASMRTQGLLKEGAVFDHFYTSDYIQEH